MSVALYLDFTKCRSCGMSGCKRLGEINRFNSVKTYCCWCYESTRHKALHNPSFSRKDYCPNCKSRLG